MDIKKTGAFIAERRKSKFMTQKELAEKLNVTDKAVSKWERGMGYPEITTIPLLAESLGVSVSEVILGELADSSENSDDIPSNTPCKTDPNVLISDTVEYMEQLHGQKASRVKDTAFIALSAVLLLAIFVCGLCNYIITKRFDWSLYVLGSAVTAWLIAAPFLKFKKHRGILSTAGLSIAIFPLLLLIEYLSPVKNWAIPFALPLVVISLVSLWALVLLVTFTKWRLICLTAIALVLFGVMDNLVIHQFVGDYLHLSPGIRQNPSTAIVAICCGFAAIVLFLLAIVSRSKAR